MERTLDSFHPQPVSQHLRPLTLIQEVDPRLGSWQDVQGFASQGDLELELMVNHISPKSHQVGNFRELEGRVANAWQRVRHV